SVMVVTGLAAAAAAWGVLMGVSPVLQIRRMLRQRSSRDVSIGYFAVLLVGFVLWLSYGIAARNLALIVPNGGRPAARREHDRGRARAGEGDQRQGVTEEVRARRRSPRGGGVEWPRG